MSSTRARHPETLAMACFVVGAITMYVGAAVATKLFDRVSVLGTTWLRVTAAAVIFVLWRRPWHRRWTRRSLALATAFGLVLIAMNGAYYLAIDRLPLGTATGIEFLGPIAVSIVGARTLRNGVAGVLAGAGVLALAGIAWEANAVGVLYALLAAAAWAGYILLGRRVAVHGGGIDGLAAGLAVGAFLTAPIGGFAVHRASPPLTAIGLALLVGVFSSVVPYALDQFVLARVGAARFALFLAILPATAALIGIVALGQALGIGEWAGLGLVVIALAIRTRPADEPPVEAATTG